VRVARDGRAAFEQFESYDPAIVLLDIGIAASPDAAQRSSRSSGGDRKRIGCRRCVHPSKDMACRQATTRKSLIP
jgi:hypothetical protein